MQLYKRFRFLSQIISHAVWLYHRFALSFRDIEEMLAIQEIEVYYETVRQWCRKFTPDFSRRLRKKRGGYGDQWFLDEVFVRINGQMYYLWRAIDQDGDELDILLTKKRDQQTALRFFKKLFKSQPGKPSRITTDKLVSYKAALRELGSPTPHFTEQYANNIAEISHQKTRVQQRQMRQFKCKHSIPIFGHMSPLPIPS